MSRELDLVLFGATGFTGQLVAAYLAQAAPPDLRWALAGRSLAKLEAVRADLAARHPALATLPLVVADSADAASLSAMAMRTRAVCTTVGPYMRYGLPLVAACAQAGTHCCDLTGETPFIRQSIDRFHDVAQATGARIVHCCGYDSIPSDLGTHVVQQAMVAAGAPAVSVHTVVGPSRGGISGGTLASMFEIMDAGRHDKDMRRLVAHSFALDPLDDRPRTRIPDQMGPQYRSDIDQWTAPFFMAMINTRLVRRSHALLGRPWGADFVYNECMAAGPGLGGRAIATGITAALGAFMAATSVPALRALLERLVLPAPGEGPSEAAREAGFFRHLVVAQGADPAHRMVARVIGLKDPGYGETAKMLGESALCLALDGASLPERAGVLTPSTAMGDALVARLRAAGMTLDAEAWPTEGVPKP